MGLICYFTWIGLVFGLRIFMLLWHCNLRYHDSSYMLYNLLLITELETKLLTYTFARSEFECFFNGCKSIFFCDKIYSCNLYFFTLCIIYVSKCNFPIWLPKYSFDVNAAYKNINTLAKYLLTFLISTKILQ
jgi:hypothetical protein